jgi:hypothetical protein
VAWHSRRSALRHRLHSPPFASQITRSSRPRLPRSGA